MATAVTKSRNDDDLLACDRFLAIPDSTTIRSKVLRSKHRGRSDMKRDQMTIDVIGVIRNNYWRIKLVRKRCIYI